MLFIFPFIFKGDAVYASYKILTYEFPLSTTPQPWAECPWIMSGRLPNIPVSG